MIVKRNGAFLGQSEVVKDSTTPLWNFVFEGLIKGNHKLPKIEDNKFEFEIRDWNRVYSHGLVGTGRLNMEDEPQISLPVYVYSGKKKVGTLFVSLIFRPVPFF